MSDLYRVAEFARLAGITVRTVQFYDRIGLLKPSQSTEGGHRLYRRRDLLRLQQILTLKWMGFKLDQIKELLESPQYDLRTALRMQKAAIDGQIASLRAASDALARALSDGALEAGMLDSDGINAVIQAVTAAPESQWARDFYSDEAWAGIVTRGMHYAPEEIAQFRQDWQELIDQFDELRHWPPDSEPVQKLAATMASYVDLFTAGDADTAEGLGRMWARRESMPAAYRLADADLEGFMAEALAIYRQRRNL
jgi:DNA-binding transcriptional MerR regulator